MNKSIISGRLTKDPEIRYTRGENPVAVARFTLAVDRRLSAAQREREGVQTADFIPCVTFGRTAEWAEKYLHQGSKIIVSGRIQTGSYINRDGNRIYTWEVLAEEAEFAESKKKDQNVQHDDVGQIDQGYDDFVDVPEEFNEADIFGNV